MQQTDGTKLTFVYDASQRISTITDALSNVTVTSSVPCLQGLVSPQPTLAARAIPHQRASRRLNSR